MNTHRTTYGYSIIIIAALIWSLTSPGIKIALDTYQIPALTVALWRDVFMGGACVLGLLLFRPALLRVSAADLRGFALYGTISIGIYHALWVWSIQLNGAAVAIVLAYTFPVFVTLGARLFFREQIRWPQLLAIAVSLLGCGLLVRVYDPAVMQVSWLGTVVGLATGLTHAVYVLSSQRSVTRHNPWVSLTYTVLFGVLALVVINLVLAPDQIAAVPGAGAWWVLALVALGPTLIGYAMFTSALRFIPGRTASLIAVIEAPAATLLSVLLLGERLLPVQIAGMALILLSMFLPMLLSRPVAIAPASEEATAPAI